MELISRFYLRDIREYESNNRVSLIDYFEDPLNIVNLIELIKLGNRLEYLDACVLLDDYLSIQGNTLYSAYIEIRDKLMGKQVSEEDNTNIQTDMYKNMTEVLNELCTQLLSIGISYSEFWSMDTIEMYQVADALRYKKIQEVNENMAQYHALAGMVGAAVWGKLKKDPPQIELEDTENNEWPRYVEGYGELTKDEYRAIEALGGFKEVQ